MRLIDADELFKKGWVLHKGIGNTYHEMPLNCPSIPTIDAVEVVRCKDCKYCSENTYNEKLKDYWCEYFYDIYDGDTHLTSADDFCSRGEKR